MKRYFGIFLASAFGLVPWGGISAQDDADPEKPLVVIPEPPFYIGRAFVYAVLAPDGTVPYQPEMPLPETPGIALDFIDSRGFEQDGKKVRLFRFNVIPLRAGEVFLPPLHLRANNKRLTVDPRRLQVLEPVESDEIAIANTLSQTECYVGQPLTFTFVWKLEVPPSQIHAVDIDVPFLVHPEFRLLAPAHAPGFGPDGSISLPVSNARVAANVVGREINFSRTVIPTRAGKFRLPASVLLCSVNRDEDAPKRGGFQYPSYFDNQFFHEEEGANFERIYARASPLKLVVKPLPKEGRPSLFNGQFGQCEIKVEVKPTEVRTGDPVTVLVVLSGHPFIESVELPPLGDMPGFADAFEVPEDRSPGVLKGTTKKFRQSVIARRSGITALPPIRLAYFDPVAGEFGQQESEAVPLTVKAALRGVTKLNDGTLLRNDVTSAEGGVRHNYGSGEILGTHVTGFRGLGGWVLWAFILAVPPLVVLAGFFVTRQRRWEREDPEAARAARAMRRFKKRVAGRPTTAEVVAATRGYLGDRLGLGAANLTADEAREELERRGVEGESVSEVKRIFSIGEGKLFSRVANGSDGEALLGDARKVVEKIEGRLR